MAEIFGEDIVNKVENSNIFIVGSGAIGCELLKNACLLGVGNTIVTDMDTIERSNLNRQFLFREKDIGSFKSEAAALAINISRPSMGKRVKALTKRVAVDTENILNDEFWGQIDVVANALDNVEARKYVDSRCVRFQVPLLESGTLGAKGSVQVVVPFLSESYGSVSDPEEPSIPVCTVKSFPYSFEHTVRNQCSDFR